MLFQDGNYCFTILLVWVQVLFIVPFTVLSFNIPASISYPTRVLHRYYKLIKEDGQSVAFRC